MVGRFAKPHVVNEPQQGVPTIHHPHVEIEHDELGNLLGAFEHLPREFAVCGAVRLVTLRPQLPLQCFSDARAAMLPATAPWLSWATPTLASAAQGVVINGAGPRISLYRRHRDCHLRHRDFLPGQCGGRSDGACDAAQRWPGQARPFRTRSWRYHRCSRRRSLWDRHLLDYWSAARDIAALDGSRYVADDGRGAANVRS